MGEWGINGRAMRAHYAFHRLRELLPPPAGGPPPSKREVFGVGCASSRNLVYNSGCRVATLLVLMGVMGFLGDLRGRNSKSPPNPLGLAERVNSFHHLRVVPLPRGGRSGGLRRSRPTALPSIGYRGFAVAPMTLRAPFRRVVITSGINGRAMRAYSFHRCGGPPPSKREVLGFASSRSLLYNSGCRVATLLVSKGVMGFLGDLRGRNRNLPLIP